MINITQIIQLKSNLQYKGNYNNMKKYIIIGKTSQETAASMLNKPQNRREMVEPLVKSFNTKFCEFLYLNSPDFDFMCVIEGESDKDIASACNLIYASGSFSMINWFRAFESSEWKEVYEIASKNMANYVSAKQAAEN